MARRPFDPAERGWRKTEYRQGDVTDAESVKDLAKGADVVVHLAFAILSAGDATRELNVNGSRMVFEAAAKAGAKRICYASSVAAYGFHDDNPDWLTEDVPARGSPEHPYSHQKAEVERVLGEVLLRRRRTVGLRVPPLHRGRRRTRARCSQAIPYFRLGEAMPGAGRAPALLDAGPPAGDPRPRHAASSWCTRTTWRGAFLAGVRGVGEPGPYNLAAGRDAHLLGRGRRARLVLGARAAPGGGGHRRDRRPGCRCMPDERGLAPLGAQAGADEDRPRAQGAALAAEAHREGHPAARWRRRERATEPAR